MSDMSLTLSGEWCVCMRERIAGFGNFVTIGGKDEKLSAEMEGWLRVRLFGFGTLKRGGAAAPLKTF